MADAAKVAAADEAMAGYLGLKAPSAPITPTTQGDTAAAKPSEEPAATTVTSTPVETPKDASGSEVSTKETPTPEVEVPAWLTDQSAREAWKANPALREAVEAHAKSVKDGIMGDATEKWMKAAALKDEAKEALDLQARLKADPAKWDAIQKIVTPPAVTVNPLKVKLAEMLGEDAAATVFEAAEQIAEAKAKATVHERVDAPVEHQRHVNAEVMALRSALGNRVTDDQFRRAVESVAVAHGWTAEDPAKPYESLTVENVRPFLMTALLSITQQKVAPASPPATPAAKPASVKSNGSVATTRPKTPWEAENRNPTSAERAQAAIAKHGLTAADWARIQLHPNG